MDERLTIQDLTDLLIDNHGMNKNNAEAFVREFFLLIEQALEEDKYVKIKGLGAFKLINVESRESVDVNTGERIEIKEHSKISFTPEASLRDFINKPFAHFEPVVLNENAVLDDTKLVESEDEDDALEDFGADDLMDIEQENQDIQGDSEISNIDDGAKENLVVEDEKIDSQKNEPVSDNFDILNTEYDLNGDHDLLNEIESENSSPTNDVDQKEIVHEKAEKGLTAEEIIANELQKDFSPMNYETKEKSSAYSLIIVIGLVLLLCGATVAYIYYPELLSFSGGNEQIDLPKGKPSQLVVNDTIISDDSTGLSSGDVADSSSIKKTLNKTDVNKIIDQKINEAIQKNAGKKVEVEKDIARTGLSKTPEIKKNAVEVKKIAKQSDSSADKAKTHSTTDEPVTYTIIGTKTTYTMKEGESFVKVASRFYGKKELWTYIAKYNKGLIKDPNNVPHGATIKIPELKQK